jgi:hypothetical protein
MEETKCLKPSRSGQRARRDVSGHLREPGGTRKSDHLGQFAAKRGAGRVDRGADIRACPQGYGGSRQLEFA